MGWGQQKVSMLLCSLGQSTSQGTVLFCSVRGGTIQLISAQFKYLHF